MRPILWNMVLLNSGLKSSKFCSKFFFSFLELKAFQDGWCLLAWPCLFYMKNRIITMSCKISERVEYSYRKTVTKIISRFF